MPSQNEQGVRVTPEVATTEDAENGPLRLVLDCLRSRRFAGRNQIKKIPR